ncbi:hypothetical protein HZS_7990, partial [Henneguya salminicola]
NITLQIWDYNLLSSQIGYFPKRLQLEDIVQVNLLHNTIYLTVLTKKDGLCLFTAKSENSYFVRKLCRMESSTDKDYCPVNINPMLTGILYATYISEDLQPHQVISVMNGKDWVDINIKLPNIECKKRPCHGKLKFPCFEKHDLDYIGWFYIADGHYIKNSLIYDTKFLTTDGGISWKPLAHSSKAIVILNRGGLFVTIDSETNNIFYSFDQGNSWKYFSLFSYAYDILSFFKVGEYENEYISVITRNRELKHITFTKINFSNLFDKVCLKHDFIEWVPPRINGHCYQGKESIYYLKKPDVKCLNKLPNFLKDSGSICPCTIDDFDCRFNYFSFRGACLKDIDAEIDEEKHHCQPGSHFISHMAGYEKLSEDSCDPIIFDREMNINHTEFCFTDGKNIKRISEYENFLLLYSEKKILFSLLKSDGRPFPKHITEIFFREYELTQFLFTFDFNNEIAYLGYQHIIFKLSVKSRISLDDLIIILYTDYYIVSLQFDPLSNSLLFLNSKNTLSVFSLETLYKKEILS